MPALDLSCLTVRQLIELDACTRCSECVRWCPVFSDGDGREHPLEKISRLRKVIGSQYGLRARLLGPEQLNQTQLADFSQTLYRCTLCNRCQVACPLSLETRELWLAARRQVTHWGSRPAVIEAMCADVARTHNIAGQDNAQRRLWWENLRRPPDRLRPGAEVVYFVGCVSGLYPGAYRIARHFVEILQHARVGFTLLGEGEWCCGFPLVAGGHPEAAAEMIEHNVALIQEIGARQVVITCPACLHMWRSMYPRIRSEPLDFSMVHASQMLEALVGAGRLRLKRLPVRVTYHDPCELGRNEGIYEAPRRVIQSIPGVTLVEMAENRAYARCCGGGGHLERVEPELPARIAEQRLAQTQATGAEVLVSACPQCLRTLAEAAGRTGRGLRVMDLVSLVQQALVVEDE